MRDSAGSAASHSRTRSSERRSIGRTTAGQLRARRARARASVPERRVAIAHVHRVGRDLHAVGERARARHHDRRARAPEGFGGSRKQRKRAAEVLLAKSKALEIGRCDAAARRIGAACPRRRRAGCRCRPRPAVGHRSEGALRTSHHEQVVVNEPDAHAQYAPSPRVTARRVRSISLMSPHSDQLVTYR